MYKMHFVIKYISLESIVELVNIYLYLYNVFQGNIQYVFTIYFKTFTNSIFAVLTSAIFGPPF